MIKIENTNSIASQCFGISKYLFVIVFVSSLLADSIHQVTYMMNDKSFSGRRGII